MEPFRHHVTTPKLSSSYHLETDGPMVKQSVSIRHLSNSFVTTFPAKKWVSLLPFAEFAYNNADHVVLGCSPFFANYQFNPRADYCTPLFTGESSVPAATARLKLFQSTMRFICENLRKAQEDA
jgi:hypothetical protein